MTEEKAHSDTQPSSFLDNLTSKVNELNQRFSQSKATQDLKKVYSDVNDELNRIGQKTSDTLDKQTAKLKENLVALKDKIAHQLDSEEPETN